MNIFQINRSAIQNRLEPKFYSQKYLSNEKNLYKSPYPVRKLSEVTMLISDGTHFTPKYQSSGKKFLSVKDVRASNIDYSNSMFISDAEFEILNKRCKPQRNDILLTKIGSIGFAAVVETDDDFQIFVSLALIRPKTWCVLPYYLELVLNSKLAYLQFDRYLKGAGVPDLHLEEIRNLKLPIPPLSVQQTIVDLYTNAQSQRKRKLEEAQKLLVGLNDYLLSELGIKLPKKDNSLSKRIFVTKFSELTSNRFDPKYILYLKDIHNFKYDIFPLKRFLIEKPQYGTAEIGIPRIKEQQPRYIRITDINDFGELDDSLGATAENCSDEYFLYENDLLFARSGATVGKTYLHKHLSYPAFFAGYMIRVRLDESTLLPDYLFAYTQTSFYKNWVDAIQRAAAQPNINAEEYASLPIPLPPIEKQREIAKHIQEIRNHAKQLKNEADMILQEAKQKVERMILGDE